MERPFDSIEQYDKAEAEQANGLHVLDVLLCTMETELAKLPGVDVQRLDEMFVGVFDALRIERAVSNEWRYYLRKEIRRLREERSYDYV